MLIWFEQTPGVVRVINGMQAAVSEVLVRMRLSGRLHTLEGWMPSKTISSCRLKASSSCPAAPATPISVAYRHSSACTPFLQDTPHFASSVGHDGTADGMAVPDHKPNLALTGGRSLVSGNRPGPTLRS